MNTLGLLILSAVLGPVTSSLACALTTAEEEPQTAYVAHTVLVLEPAQVRHGAEPTAIVSPLSSCAEVKAASPGAGDGEYTLSLGGHPASIYCKDMAGTPSEYLTLRRTRGGANTSHYGAGQNTGPGGLVTAYTRVRFHPDTLRVDWNDATFASSTGWNSFGPNRHTTWGWGNAGDCAATGSATGTSSIDLRGTPFAVALGEFSTEGWHPAGSAQYSAEGQVVTLEGGGYCGNTGPKSPQLQLTWLDA